MNANNIETTPFDNEITLLYKWSAKLETPTRLIVVRQNELSDKTDKSRNLIYEPFWERVSDLNGEETDPRDVFTIITELNSAITIDDIIMAYYYLMVENAKNNSENLDSNASESLAMINGFYENMDERTKNKFTTWEQVNDTFTRWYNKNKEDFASEIKRRTTIINVQRQLSAITPTILLSPLDITSNTIAYRPTIMGRNVSIADGIDILNAAIVSENVPYIRYNDNFGRPFYRVYTGDRTETTPNYDVTILPKTATPDKNTIYLHLWTDRADGASELRSAAREAFSLVIYHLDSNYLTIESPADSKKNKDNNVRAATNIQNALPNLVIGAGKETKVKGEFNIWSMELEETSLLDMILLEPLMNVYLYVEENSEPFAFKKRLVVHYRSIYSDIIEGSTAIEEAYISNSASVSVTITQKIAEKDEVVEWRDFKDGQTKKGMLKDKTPYLQFNITQGETQAIVEQFVQIFRLLFQHYYDTRTAIFAKYPPLVPGITTLPALLNEQKASQKQDKTGVNKRSNRRTTTTLLDLQKHAPDLFVRGYSRECQGTLQPTLLREDELQAWANANIGRQAMPFAKSAQDKPEYYFACSNDAAPFPGLKENCKLDNREDYPYIPCCFKTDQMQAGTRSTYNNYLQGLKPNCKEGAKAEDLIKTGTILNPGRMGKLPIIIENILKRYEEDVTQIVRYGVINSVNSLLHCVCVAVADPNYLQQVKDDNKELYVTRLRAHIAATVKASLLRQEFYDSNDADIMNALTNNELFFDPALFYRAVEETFNINLYVFLPPTTNVSNASGSLEVPRHKVFHTRPIRLYRNTVLVIKSDDGTSDYPHCELIAEIDSGIDIKLFAEPMTNICYNILRDSMRTISWSLDKNNNNLQARANVYYHIDHLEMLKAPAVSQFIDDNGKMRALTLNVQGEHITVAVIPSQPENLPHANDMAKASVTLAVKMFGQPNAVTRDASLTITGLWFKVMDIEHGEYVPVNSDNFASMNLPLGPSNPILPLGVADSDISLTGRLAKLRHTLNIIVQLTKWLYEIARNSDAEMTPNKFALSYMSYNSSPVLDSSTYYDFSSLQRRLPKVQTVESAINNLSHISTLFANGRIIMYSLSFYERMYNMLIDYHTLHFGDLPSPPEFINNFYETETNYRQVPSSKLFISEKDLTAWLASLRGSLDYSRYYNIRRKLDQTMSLMMDPYLYQDDDGRIFLVQNVVGGNLLRALTVTNFWTIHKINIGPEPPASGSSPLYMIYGISSTATMVPIKDETNKQEIFEKILYYGSQADLTADKKGNYAALLELL